MSNGQDTPVSYIPNSVIADLQQLAGHLQVQVGPGTLHTVSSLPAVNRYLFRRDHGHILPFMFSSMISFHYAEASVAHKGRLAL